MTASRSSTLGDRYAEHNRGRGRGFIFGGTERSEALRAVIARAPSHGPVLDLGCRDGSLATALGLPRDRTIGADIDPEALASARDADALAPCTADLWGPFPFRDGAFSLVVGGRDPGACAVPAGFHRRGGACGRARRPDRGFGPQRLQVEESGHVRLGALVRGRSDASAAVLTVHAPRDPRAALGAGRVTPCVGRFARWWPRMFGNDLVWTGVKP